MVRSSGQTLRSGIRLRKEAGSSQRQVCSLQFSLIWTRAPWLNRYRSLPPLCIVRLPYVPRVNGVILLLIDPSSSMGDADAHRPKIKRIGRPYPYVTLHSLSRSTC
jgi:hypothetical protein